MRIVEQTVKNLIFKHYLGSRLKELNYKYKMDKDVQNKIQGGIYYDN